MRTLDVIDRCDRCGAQAFALALIGETELLFCGHHFAQHADALTGYPVSDQRDRINAKPSTSASV